MLIDIIWFHCIKGPQYFMIVLLSSTHICKHNHPPDEFTSICLKGPYLYKEGTSKSSRSNFYFYFIKWLLEFMPQIKNPNFFLSPYQWIPAAYNGMNRGFSYLLLQRVLLEKSIPFPSNWKTNAKSAHLSLTCNPNLS